jgi:F-type H+-transporting ATPase subunit a
MMSGRLKSLLVAAFSVLFLSIGVPVLAQPHDQEQGHEQHGMEQPAGHETGAEATTLEPSKVIIEHVMDSHEFHFFTMGDFHATIPLPVILYSPQRGFDVFMSSKFHHGHDAYKGYRMAEGENIVAVKDDGVTIDDTVKVYDFSMTKNVVQMIIALALLVWIMTTIARRYSRGEGVITAPKGMQNLMEPVITFVRDEVAKPNLGHKYFKYLPYLLTVFFFILINNLFGLLPGFANVTGNVAFTLVLGVISFIVIIFSSNSHYWGHILWPPGVPLPIKFILIPVELMGVFTKPFALIVRLFANMVAGHIIILSFICLIFIFGAMNTALGWGTSPFFILLAVFIYLIEVLVVFIQAFIFTNLTAVFIGQAFEGSHDDVDHHEDPVIL